jgi:excinuclease ABC subunit A
VADSTPSRSQHIRIRGAREHNLKSISLDIPRDQLIVITGLSGSGKSTLAFDTVFAEGQRKYMESLSTYARQFLDQLQKPDIDEIEGLPPTIAIEQRSASHNPRSTVATTTEIYDYLRVLFARAGKPHCWKCGRVIAGQSASQIVDSIMSRPAGTKLMVLAPLVRGQKGEHKETFAAIHKQGFVRARVDGALVELPTAEAAPKLKKTFVHTIEAIVDRIVLKPEIRSRLADSVETALKLTQGTIVITTESAGQWTDQTYSEKFACPDHPEVSLTELEPRLFSFNSPHGACPSCHGLGTLSEFDPDLIVPDETLPLSGGAIDPWRRNGMRMNIYYSRILRTFCRDFGLSYEKPFKDLPKSQRDILIHGSDAKGTSAGGTSKTGTWFEGVIPNLQRRFDNTESEHVKHRLHEYMSEQPCPVCRGARLKIDALAVRVESSGSHTEGTPLLPEVKSTDPKQPKKSDKSLMLPGVSIHDVTSMTVDAARSFFASLKLNSEGEAIAAPVVRELNARLGFMHDVGLGYLTLDRRTGTLSGGEAQRIRLATQVGSGLVGVAYVLDEPTIGLHQRDNDRLVATLRKLQLIGNTVIIVEHDEDCIRTADHLIDIGPGAGAHGGHVIAQGSIKDLLTLPPGQSSFENSPFAFPRSTTLKYLRGELVITLPESRRKLDFKSAIKLTGCRENNLENVSLELPLGGLVCVTGVSGSGKSTLINQTFLPALKRRVMGTKDKPGQFDTLIPGGKVDKVIEIDQSPIGRTPRSNPATYTGVFDDIRQVFAKTNQAKIRGYEGGRFSFNVKGGRCESCQGQGTKCIEMHFLPDVYVSCEVCKGTRYNAETLDIVYRGKNIAQVLAMTVEESLGFFENHPRIHQHLKALNDVGLGYIKLGQPSTQLSGGEAQRVKLATELGRSATGHTLYVLDEPTTGLHFADIQNLLNVLQRLADMGNSVVVIEHNLDVIKCADWIIDLGPDGGTAGGTIVTTGTPEEVAQHPTSYTGQYLKSHLPNLPPTTTPALTPKLELPKPKAPARPKKAGNKVTAR